MKRLSYRFLLTAVLAFGPGRNAFVQDEEEPFEMRAMDLGNNALPSNGPLPSPDGRFLIYSHPRGSLQVADTETGNNWTLFASPVASWKDARWLKDGPVVLSKVDSRVEWKSFEGVTYSAVLRFIESRAQK